MLMDLRLPDGTGIDACREILSSAPRTRILFVTSYSDEQAVMSTVLAGAAGYVLKDIDHRALVAAIRDAAAGRAILDPRITDPVVSARAQDRSALRAGAARAGAGGRRQDQQGNRRGARTER